MCVCFYVLIYAIAVCVLYADADVRLIDVFVYSGLVPWSHILFGDDGVWAKLLIGVSQTLTDRVNAKMITRLKEVDVRQFAFSRWI